MLLGTFPWCINSVSKKSSLFNIFSTSPIAFITGRSLQHMENIIRNKGNTNNTSVIIFFNWKSKTPSNGTLLGRTSGEVFIIVVNLFLFFILLLFFIHFCFSFCFCSSFIFVLHLLLFFIHCFSTSSFTLPWTIAGFLHPFYTFSPAHRRVICDTFISNLSGIFLPWVLWFWMGIFLPTGIFYLTLPHQHFWLNLILSRPPQEPAVLPWSFQGFILILETQTWPICLFDSK